MVPEPWQKTLVGELLDSGDILEIKDGNHGNDHPKAEDYVEQGVPFIMANDLVDGSIDFSSCSYISKKQADGLRTGFAKPGDVLLSHKGTVGAVAIVPDGFDYIMLTPQVTYYRVAESGQLDAKFLYYCFQEYGFQSWMKRLAFQSTRFYIGITEQKKRLSISLPPLSEQKEIASILSCWDSAISVVRAAIKTSRVQKRALSQQLLTGKQHLAGFEGGWFDTRLRDFLLESGVRNRGEKTARVLSVSNKHGFILPEQHFSKRVASENTSNYKIVRRGQYAYNPSRINVGSFARLDNFDAGIVSPMYVVFSVDEERLDNDYYYHWMNSHQAQGRIASLTQGSVRNSVSFDALGSLPIRVPPVDEQKAISTVLSKADSEIERHCDQLASLEEEKKALMQQLLTGKRRVKVDQEAA